jgi:hypothetical protein
MGLKVYSMGFSGDFMVFHGVFNGCCSDSVVGKTINHGVFGLSRSSVMPDGWGQRILCQMIWGLYVHI